MSAFNSRRWPACRCKKPCEVDPCPSLPSSKEAAKRARRAKKQAKQAKATPAPKPAPPATPQPQTVSTVFEPFAAQLRAIDWRDPVKRESEVGAIIGQMFAAVALAPALSDADREKLQWLMSLSRQMVAFRDASAIEAARRKLSGEDEAKPEDVDGPQLEPTIVVSGPDNSEADGGRARQTFRGRPRARTFS